MNNPLPPVLLPPACLPDVEFFTWLLFSAQAVIEVHETFPKQTCRNRYRIPTANGPLVLSIPVIRPKGNHTPFQEIRIDQSTDWARIHWRAIESAYNKSPFFLYYRDDFELLFQNPPGLLIDFNFSALNLCARLIGSKPEFTITETFQKDPESFLDMRHSIMPKQALDQAFTIREWEPYVQVFSDRQEFMPNLSILDLIFNLGPDTVNYLSRHLPQARPE
ncbi:MAG: WbqC family protein [Lentimicrobium sp.]|nr:WbqC family protein [Lentimicrobium sp.]